MKTLIHLIWLLFFSVYSYGQTKNLGENINSSKMEYRPIVSKNGRVMFFTIQKSTQTRRDSQEIWMARKTSKGEWLKATRMPDYINSQKYNSVYWCSDDAGTILLRGTYDSTNRTRRGFSISEIRDGRWTYPTPIKVNNIELLNRGIFTGATLSTDRNVLIMYFSNETNSGMNDLWISKYDSTTESYSTPEILPFSEEDDDEITPYIASDNKTLFYSSDKIGGYGNHDIWMTKRLDTTWKNWTKPVNIGAPFNSKYWDAYFSIGDFDTIAYFATNKKTTDTKSFGGSDIYSAFLPETFRPEKPVEPIHDTIIITIIKCDTIYKTIPCNPLDTMSMDELKKELKKGRILFDYGKSILRSDAFRKLDVMIAILQKNPDMEIELDGHSDSLGTAKGNMKQSIERAQSAKGYLLSRGINQNRIFIKGYGDKKPVATNKTDAGRQLNRRVEIVIEEQ